MIELYKRLLEFTHDAVHRYSFDGGVILLANKGLVELLDLQCSPEELVGRRLRDVLIYIEKEGTIRNALLENGEIHGFEYHFKTLKGNEKWVVHDSFLTLDNNTGQQVVDAVVRDITFRKQAEKDLAEEKERLAVTLRSIAEGVVAVDLQGRIMLLNAAAEEFAGVAGEQAVGKPFFQIFELIDKQSREPLKGFVSDIPPSGTVRPMPESSVLIGRHGRERDMADSIAAIRNRHGEVIGAVLVMRDVTEQKKAEAELSAYRAELENLVRQRTRELEHACKELEHSNKALEEFAYVVSHDLQEPLRTVASFAKLLEKRFSDKLDQDGHDFINFITDGAHRGQRLVNELLQYSRVGTRGKPLEAISASDSLAMALNNLQFLIRESNATVEHFPLPIIEGDLTQLTQVFQNLIANAIKFGREGISPHISISATQNGDMWVFRVKDNGIGMETRCFERIFIIFQQIHGGKYPGTGMGLAICKRIIERHGGRIWVESEPDKGCNFFFTLPVLKRGK